MAKPTMKLAGLVSREDFVPKQLERIVKSCKKISLSKIYENGLVFRPTAITVQVGSSFSDVEYDVLYEATKPGSYQERTCTKRQVSRL